MSATENLVPVRIDHRERVARRKLGNPENFEFYHWRAFGDGNGRAVMLTGCVVTSVYSKGPRKGQPKYDGAPMTAYVTSDEEAEERTRWAAETGKCPECYGLGHCVTGWKRDVGTTWKTCRACGGAK